MPDLAMTDIPEPLYEALCSLARQERVSLEEEARRILARGLAPVGTVGQRMDVLHILARLKARRRLCPAKQGLPDSLTLLRGDRAR